MSSAHIIQLIRFDSSTSTGLQLSSDRRPGKSAKNILNKRGLRIHPCFTA